MIKPYDGRIRANALHIPLVDNSVNMCVTSPPYWGLRSYLIPDQIFGGDAHCKHKFTQPRRRGGPAGSHGGASSCRPGRSNVEAQKRQNDCLGSFCVRCGAWKGQLGLEPDPYLYVDHIVEIFREIWRVLRPDGTVWLNIGDCYATGAGKVRHSPGGGQQGARYLHDVARVRDGKRTYRNDAKGRGTPYRAGAAGSHKYRHYSEQREYSGPITQPNRLPIVGLKPKDMVGMPWRIALALQADGWFWRSSIVWAKPSPMPGSQKDRPTSSWEPILLFSKSQRYFYDHVAVMEPTKGNAHSRGNGIGPKTTDRSVGGMNNLSMQAAVTEIVLARNRRDVWSVSSEPLAEPHYAAYPQALIEPCILAGTSEHGCCANCGAPYRRLIEKQLYGNMQPTDGMKEQNIRRTTAESKAKYRAAQKSANGSRMFDSVKIARANGADHEQMFLPPRTLGWKKTCKCETSEVVPAIVLDPFFGSGTTGRVCERFNRRWVGLDLGYQEMQSRRLHGVQKQLTGLVV